MTTKKGPAVLQERLTLKDFTAPSTPRRCIVGRLLDALGEDDRSAAVAAMAGAQATYTSSKIAEVLTRRAGRVSDMSVTRHRRELCCCPQTNEERGDG